MQAIQFDRFGGPAVLQLVDLPMPQPGPGQVRIKVHAAGINYFEALMRADRYAVSPVLPMVPGVEVAGTVDACGEGVDALRIGTRVAAPLFAAGQGSGGYAEYVTIDAGAVVELPSRLDFASAAALMVQGLTALHLVRQSPPASKDVLVNAAAGGVGSLLVQLARQAGARTIVAAAGSPDKLAFARGLGADAGVDYTQADWPDRVREATGGRGVDIAYDMVGGTVTRPSRHALAQKGELVFGALGRFSLDREDMDAMFAQNQSLRGFALLPLLEPAGMRADLAALFQLASDGKLSVGIGGRYPLAEAGAAHQALESRATTGKLILEI